MREDPHLLFLWTDQQRWDTLGTTGSATIETPNLDSIAETSAGFRRAYVTQPICGPSRATVMTGKYPHSTGVTGTNIPLLPSSRA